MTLEQVACLAVEDFSPTLVTRVRRMQRFALEQEGVSADRIEYLPPVRHPEPLLSAFVLVAREVVA